MMRDFVKQRRDARDYDVWFRAEVEAGLRQLDDPNVELVPNDVVIAAMEQECAEFLKRINEG